MVESARLRATPKGIRERLWAACSNERRVPFRDIAGHSLDRPAADASLRLGLSQRGESRREVDNAKCRRPPCPVRVKAHRMKGEVRRPTWRNSSTALHLLDKLLPLSFFRARGAGTR
jgi:hypothetical protein